ncbi:hypothetical protein ACFRFJ_12625 [Streptomyces hydrogenans]|uniref:hypothetical protein n=1 Tax=Streptomyces hydrogenans TaxID=1873719 RepID=UPI00367C40A1
MRHRSTAEQMAPAAVGAGPRTPFEEVARLLDRFDEEHRPPDVVDGVVDVPGPPAPPRRAHPRHSEGAT